MVDYTLVDTPNEAISVFDGEPDIEVHKNCIYVPLTHGNFWENTEWGIYNRRGCIIDAAVHSNDPGLKLTGQSLLTNINPNEIQVAPRQRYFYVGFVITHYGHFICSTMSRLWALGKYDLTETPLLAHGAGDPPHWFSSIPFAPTLFGAAGINQEDFAYFDRPTLIPELVVPYPAFVERNLSYEIFAQTAKAWGDRLVKTQDLREKIDIAYISKTQFSKNPNGLSNEQPIVNKMQEHGIPIFYPEQLSIPQQVSLFRRSRCLIGQASSAFHNLAFANQDPDQSIIQINMDSRSYSANHALIDKSRKIESKYVYFEGEWRDHDDRIARFEIKNPDKAAQILIDMAKS